jgi:sugar O-acyltransferase (sialic acid O-acetyltransferase NeuD family)
MIVLGASRHAKEVLQIMIENQMAINYLFDDFSNSFSPFFDNYTIIKSFNDSRIIVNDGFVLALGGTRNRKKLFEQSINKALVPISVISNTAVVGVNGVNLGVALNIMHFVFIADSVKIGNGSLINAYASIHHDVIIGEFSEISPRAVLLGGVIIGNYTSIGAGAIILPNISVGNNCIIGAGSVVTKNIDDNSVCYGVPAKYIKNKE